VAGARGAAALCRGGRVAGAGAEADLPRALVPGEALPELDAGGGCVLPGFVDAHTHLVFAGDRADEHRARLSGEPYRTGGILRTVAATRAASTDDLAHDTWLRAQSALRSEERRVGKEGRCRGGREQERRAQ